MKKATVTVSFDDEKLNALTRYMMKKDVNLEEQLTAQIEKMYQKYVPTSVQEYIEEKEQPK